MTYRPEKIYYATGITHPREEGRPFVVDAAGKSVWLSDYFSDISNEKIRELEKQIEEYKKLLE